MQQRVGGGSQRRNKLAPAGPEHTRNRREGKYMAKRTKGLQWHMSSQEAAVEKKNPEISTRLGWLVDGVLAKLVVVERSGRRRASTKHTKTLGYVIVVKVHSQHPKGFSDILRDGRVEYMSNHHLRPADE